MISDEILKLIREKFNSPVQYPQQCEALSMAIHEATGKTLSTTTLKRMLGFVKGPEKARQSSLDILAQYLGYPDFKLLEEDLGIDTDISDFRVVDSVDSSDLEIGEQIQLTYEPTRLLLLSYLGGNKFLVKESCGSKLIKGDILMIAGFYVGFVLLVTDVERGGQHLGAYQAAKQGGITSVEII